MSRIPPSLSYLTIYNPTLKPSALVSPDDEDAEEQAHILFYTSRERAVSRDRMLRQIGLAKALVNFAEMFNPDDSCDNVHSQSRRMIMVSPEPDFWIHAGVDMAKTPKTVVEKVKGKGKDKGKTPERAPAVQYDYQDSSVHDLALRADILRGYERFKLTHGSFTSILSTIGQQALELQLERFFTVWAWSWNLEDGYEFGDHLGIPLHPLYRTLIQILDQFSSDISYQISPILICPPYVVPSTRFKDSDYPPSLPHHLLSLVTPPPEPTRSLETSSFASSHSDATVKAQKPTTESSSKRGEAPSAFLGMPSITMNVNMDVRKWSWPGYLSFGKASSRKPIEEQWKRNYAPDKQEVEEPKSAECDAPVNSASVEVDRAALEDAISSDNSSVLGTLTEVSATSATLDGEPTSPAPPSLDAQPDPNASRPPSILDTEGPHIRALASSDTSSLASSVSEPIGSSQLGPPPEFSTTTVHLEDPEEPSMTRRRKILYLMKYPLAIALVGVDADVQIPDDPALDDLAQKAVVLLQDIEKVIDEDTSTSVSATDTIGPSATKILQPKDRHILTASNFTLSSPDFTSNSEHLYNAQQLQEMHPDISEVFSRGQNPQYWHVARHGLGVDGDGIHVDGEIYMEVFRKETSLTDVDNVLAGLVGRFTDA